MRYSYGEEGATAHMRRLPLPWQVRLQRMHRVRREAQNSVVEWLGEHRRRIREQVYVVFRRRVERFVDLLYRDWLERRRGPSPPSEDGRVKELSHDLELKPLERLPAFAIERRHVNVEETHHAVCFVLDACRSAVGGPGHALRHARHRKVRLAREHLLPDAGDVL